MEKEKIKHLIALGIRIRELRNERHISQRKLALMMGKDRQSLHRIEKGLVNPGYLWLLQLADALNVDISELLIGNSGRKSFDVS